MQTLHVDQKTFRDYAAEDILHKVQAYCSKYKRVDIVFDVYKKSSLKSETRAQRGKAIRRRVTESSKTPSNWKNFLRDDDNKTELFSFLASKICQVVAESTIVVTNGEEIVSNKSEITESSDLGLAIGLEKLCIAFGQGAHSRWIPIHDIVSTIGPERSSGLPFFHAFSGCDVVSAFRGKAKKSVWQTWNVCDEVSGTLTKLSHWPTTVDDDDDLQMLVRFVVIM